MTDVSTGGGAKFFFYLLKTNLSGVGFKPRNAIRAQPNWNQTWKQYPITNKTDNNKMQMSVRSLELIFTETDWPETEHQLEVSLERCHMRPLSHLKVDKPAQQTQPICK